MSKYFFDIGANTGTNSLHFLEKDDWTVFAFEPTPALVTYLKEKVNKNDKNDKNSRYNIIEKVVGNENKIINFNIAGHHDWGCSSVLNFRDNLDTIWKNRDDFYFNSSVKVQMIKLKDFCIANNINKIDYLHIDAQGFDYEVLLGLDNMIENVYEGCVETAQNHDVKLYKEQKYVLDDMVKLLIKHNFTITKIVPNDIQYNEVNIYFKK